MAEKEFKVNEYITLKLERNRTKIYVNKEGFEQCYIISVNVQVEKITSLNEVESIDKSSERYFRSWKKKGFRLALFL